MLARLLNQFRKPTSLAAVASQVDDSPGWGGLQGGYASFFAGQDYDPARVQEIYSDALSAWRKNPIAWRIIAITSDYVVGERLSISSPQRRLEAFIQRFWHHPLNRLDLRLETMCDELSRSGDLFALLFRNPADGMSYLRFVTKDRIVRIETAPNDWESELVYHEALDGIATRAWLAPVHPQASEAEAVMLHYSVNRPLGALLGESDLTSMLPWLQRYSRMLEDRVRLHWAARAFLWTVTVPSHRVREKAEQYRTPPDTGSIIIKDEGETWQAVAPSLHAVDAGHDLKAVRGMIDAGSGYPPHWRGEAADANLATAAAMQAPTERHLRRRQQYFLFILEDLLYQAYQRAVQAGLERPLPSNDYQALFAVSAADITPTDNEALARSANLLAQALTGLQAQLPGRSPTLQRLLLRLVLRFAGEPLPEEQIQAILDEARP
jgi:hypothetical protein